MHISGVNKFTYPLIFQRGNIATITRKILKPNKWFQSEKKELGRWNLKHNDKDLNQFYQYLPDPGYPNNYLHKSKGVVLDSSK